MNSPFHRQHHHRVDEEEKPFWISFADLMTALMVLFLVVMSVALLAVSKTVTEAERKREKRLEDIELLMNEFVEAASRYEGIRIDRNRRVIDFQERARFGFASHSLTQDQRAVLRQFVPEILSIAEGEVGKRILKRVVVEGYTDKAGTYLANLDLSLKRAQRVLCAMLESGVAFELSNERKKQVRDLFLVGGYSFNNGKDTDGESRRVEMRLELLGLDEMRDQPPEIDSDFGRCQL